jgi:TetR/AcrR family transcriptional repressor of nem operon
MCHMMKNTLKPKKSELTRSALIEEGIQQLSEHGYHGTGIKQVLDAVKVPKGSFYNYFGSKEAYVAEIIVEYNHQALAMFDEFVNQSKLPALDQLKTIYEFMLIKFADNSCQKGCLVGSIAAEIGNTFELCQLAMQASVNDWLLRLNALISQGQLEGAIRKDIPSTDLAELIWSAWEGSLIKMKMDGDIQSPKKIIYLTLETLLKP